MKIASRTLGRSSLLGVTMAVGLAVPAASVKPAVAGCEPANLRIALDVGHSPSWPGALSARGRPEHDFNLQLTAFVETRLASLGFRRVSRIESSDPGGDLSRRLSDIQALGPDVLISIHHDSVQPAYLEKWIVDGRPQLYSDRFSGWSLFVSGRGRGATASLRFARLIGDRLLARGLPFSRHHAERIGGESRTFADATRGVYRRDGLAVLRDAPAVAVLLEAGIIVHRDEEIAVSSRSRQSALADALGEALQVFCTQGGR